MSLLFLSHSSRNNAETIALRDWLVEQGWDNLFVDLDPERGIVAGERWESALHQAADRCDAVLFLISQAWLDSEWCRWEFQQAQRLNKRIFLLLIEDFSVDELPIELTEHWQLVNLVGGSNDQPRLVKLPGSDSEIAIIFSKDGLTSLKAGLNKAGLDPQYYPWPPAHDLQRPPYRGLLPLEAEDAGIFFGREAPLIDMLARLRGLREGPPPRFLVVLGASGAGKSSFLRAGILPRLSRDDRFFCPLPPVRPEQAVLDGPSGFVSSLTQACREHGLTVTRNAVQEKVYGSSDSLQELLSELQIRATPPSIDDNHLIKPQLVLPLDQGEELFQAEGREQSQAFLKLLKNLLQADNPSLLVIWTIRSDSYEALQSAPELEGIHQHTFSLPPMPTGSYHQVIEGPARILSEKSSDRRLVIEPGLTQALLHDLESGTSRDALPLLAFTLERLYYNYGNDGQLTLEEYKKMGGVRGAIEGAVDNALKDAQSNPKLPGDRQECLKLLRRGLIPWLAGIDPETNQPRRRIAYLEQVPDESRAVIQHFIDHRLLATDTDSKGEITLEPAHEALLRQWSDLTGWLDEDAAALSSLETVKSASRDWSANTEDPHWLIHQKGRLEDAEELLQRSDLAESLSPIDRRYLKACRQLENETRERELQQAKELADSRNRVVKRTRLGLIVALILMVMAGGAAYWATQNAEIARSETQRAEEEAERARQTLVQIIAHRLATSTLDSLQGSQSQRGILQVLAAKQLTDDIQVQQAVSAVSRELGPWIHRIINAGSPITSVAISPNERFAVTGHQDHTIQLWNLDTGQRVGDPWGESYTAHGRLNHGRITGVSNLIFTTDGNHVLSAMHHGSRLSLWDVQTGQLVNESWNDHDSLYGMSIALSPDGSHFVTDFDYSNLRIINLNTMEAVGEIWLGDMIGTTLSLSYSPDGRYIAAGTDYGIHLWDTETGARLGAPLLGDQGWVFSVDFSPNGRYLISGGSEGNLVLWDVETGQPVGESWKAHEEAVWAVSFSPDGHYVASGSHDGALIIWDVETGTQLAEPWRGHYLSVRSLAFFGSGAYLLSGATDTTLRLWSVNVHNTDLGEPLINSWHTDTAPMILEYSPDGRHLIAGDISIGLWNTETGQQIGLDWEGHEWFITSAAFSPDGKYVVTGSLDKTLRLWLVETGTQVGEPWEGHTDAVEAVTFSPDGLLVASSGRDNTIRLWNTARGITIGEPLYGHNAKINSIDFSPDGSLIVSGSSDKTLRLWDTETGEQIGEPWQGHESDVLSLSFSPDGKYVISGGADGQIILWDAANGQQHGEPWEVQSERAYKDVIFLSFSADGQQVISGGKSGDIRVWSVETGQIIHSTYDITKYSESDFLSALAIRPDARRVASGYYSGHINIWAEPRMWRNGDFIHKPQGAYERLCGIINRNMSQEEWDEWISPDIPYVVQCSDLPVPNADLITP